MIVNSRVSLLNIRVLGPVSQKILRAIVIVNIIYQEQNMLYKNNNPMIMRVFEHN